MRWEGHAGGGWNEIRREVHRAPPSGEGLRMKGAATLEPSALSPPL